MEPGEKRKPPPPPPPRAAKGAASPSTEGIMVADGGVSQRMLSRLRLMLQPSLRNSLIVDVTGRIFAGGQEIGVQERNRFLLEYGPVFSNISLPAAMRNVLQSGSMVVFIEVTEADAHICAGSALGKKIIYSRLG